MVIGLKYGQVDVENAEAKEKTYEIVHEFTRRFKAIHGSLRCKDLLGYDVSVPEELELAEEKELFETFCPKLVEDSVKILEKIL